jgi:hypothetical protein
VCCTLWLLLVHLYYYLLTGVLCVWLCYAPMFLSLPQAISLNPDFGLVHSISLNPCLGRVHFLSLNPDIYRVHIISLNPDISRVHIWALF